MLNQSINPDLEFRKSRQLNRNWK